MKKNITICLGILVTVIFIFVYCLLCSVKKVPITPEKFIEIVKSRNIETQEIAVSKNAALNKVASKIITAGEYATFAKCHSLKIAEGLYSHYNNKIVETNTKNGVTKFNNVVSFSNNHYSYKSYNTNKDNFTIIRVGDTVVRFDSSIQYKNETNNIVKAMGYDVGQNVTVLGASFIILILCIFSLIYFCIVSIIKKYNFNSKLIFLPFFNLYYICKIADKSGWKIIFLLIPFFGILYYFVLMYKLAKLYINSKLLSFLTGFIPTVILPLFAFDKPKNKLKNFSEHNAK